MDVRHKTLEQRLLEAMTEPVPTGWHNSCFGRFYVASHETPINVTSSDVTSLTVTYTLKESTEQTK